MKLARVIARILLGLPLLVFGLNGLFQFMEPPSQPPPEAVSFLKALQSSGYLMPLSSSVQVVSGICFLSGLFVPFALILFAPVLVNIVAFHIYLDDPINGMLGYVLLVLELFLAWAYWPSFKGVLAARGAQRS